MFLLHCHTATNGIDSNHGTRLVSWELYRGWSCCFPETWKLPLSYWYAIPTHLMSVESISVVLSLFWLSFCVCKIWPKRAKKERERVERNTMLFFLAEKENHGNKITFFWTNQHNKLRDHPVHKCLETFPFELLFLWLVAFQIHVHNLVSCCGSLWQKCKVMPQNTSLANLQAFRGQG